MHVYRNAHPRTRGQGAGWALHDSSATVFHAFVVRSKDHRLQVPDVTPAVVSLSFCLVAAHKNGLWSSIWVRNRHRTTCHRPSNQATCQKKESNSSRITPEPSPPSSWLIGGGIRHHPHPLNDAFRYLSVSYLDDDEETNRGHGNFVGAPSCCSRTIVGVALNRPGRRNALNRDLWSELGSFFGQLDPSSCRVVLLHAWGDAFCSGIDLTDTGFLPNKVPAGVVDPGRAGLAFLSKLRQMQECFTALETCGIPVVAAVHGPCVGAGVDLVCAADVVWATTASFFSVREVALGLAADVGTLQRLPKRSGNQSLVREVCLTGRNFDANEALRMGLVGRVFPNRDALMREAFQLCRVIASHSPLAVAGTKRALLRARDRSVEDGLDDTALFNALALQSPDVRIAMKAAARRNKTKTTSLSYPDLLPRSKL